MHARPMHPIGAPQQDRHGWSPWYMTWSVAMVMGLGLTLLSPSSVQARTFQCRAGDVGCLIGSITQANVQPGQQHEIRLEAGTYTLVDWENDTDGLNGLPSITSKLTIRGAGEDVTILERNMNAAQFRLFHVAATGGLTLYGLTVRGGFSSFSLFSGGGGLFNAGGGVTILHSTFIGNSGGFGGGLWSAGGTVTILKSTFARNFNFGAAGGGGGLFVTGGAAVTIDASTIAGNHGDVGGGLFIIDGATVSVTNSAIVENSGTTDGGGIASVGTLTITNSTIARNTAGQGTGGGIRGGGMIINSTIVENSAYSVFSFVAGGVDGPVTLQNTILAHNVFSPGEIPSDCRSGGSATSLGHNLIGDLTGCTITLLSSDLTGETGLGGLLYSETPGYAHYPLLQGSPAIDRGNPDACPKTDQLGQKRVGPCDIGAIEFQGEFVSSR